MKLDRKQGLNVQLTRHRSHMHHAIALTCKRTIMQSYQHAIGQTRLHAIILTRNTLLR